MQRVVHEMKDGEWWPTKYGFRMRSGDLFVAVADDGCGSWNAYQQNSVDCVLETISEQPNQSRDAAMHAAEQWLEQQDRPQWIDLPSGLAAMCEWRGCSLVSHPFQGGYCWCSFVRDGYRGESGIKSDLASAKSAAEVWVRAQTGGAA